MRAASIACCAAISAASTARVRAISSARVFSSEAMRSAFTAVIWAMRSFSVASRAAISASSTARVRSMSRRRVSSSLTMRASVTARSCRMRAFSTCSRAAISASSHARACARSRCWRTSRSEAIRASLIVCWLAMLRLLDLFAGRDLGLLDRARALDLALAHVTLGRDARFADRPLVGNARLLDLLARRRSAPARPRCRAAHARARARRAARRGGLRRHAAGSAARSRSRARCRAPAARLRGCGVRIRIIDSCSMSLRSLRRDSISWMSCVRPCGVEAVRRVEVFEIGLVEIGDRDRLQLEAVLREALGGGLLHARDIVAALLVHLLHRHLGGDRAQRRDELAGEQRVQALLLHGAAAERGRRRARPASLVDATRT